MSNFLAAPEVLNFLTKNSIEPSCPFCQTQFERLGEHYWKTSCQHRCICYCGGNGNGIMNTIFVEFDKMGLYIDILDLELELVQINSGEIEKSVCVFPIDFHILYDEKLLIKKLRTYMTFS